MVWKPHVTVAAVIENDKRFLMVEEQTPTGLAFNQPAGHLEENEDLIHAVKREVSEETGWQFEPEFIVSIQLWKKKTGPTFLRVCFSGRCHSYDPAIVLDEDIIGTHWLSRKEISDYSDHLRSPLVISSVDEYLNGQQYPLTLLKSLLAP